MNISLSSFSDVVKGSQMFFKCLKLDLVLRDLHLCVENFPSNNTDCCSSIVVPFTTAFRP